MARWRRWVLPIRAPSDEFLRLLQHGLTVRGVHVEDAKRFDLMGRAFGTRAYLALEWADEGVALTVKLKSTLFGSPAAMERVVREAAEEAAAKLNAPSTAAAAAAAATAAAAAATAAAGRTPADSAP